MTLKDAWKITRLTVEDFFDSSILKLSASLAFFTIFSLPGLLIIIIWVSHFFYGRDIIEGSLFHKIESFVGHTTALDIQETIHNATHTSEGTLTTIIGLIALIIGATSVFGEIQDSINRIWRLKAKPKKGFGILKLIFNRLLSFSIIISLGFILLVSLILSGVMDYFMNKLAEKYPDLTIILVYVINVLSTVFVTALIFAAIFKVLPDAKIKWRHVWVGAGMTAVLFMFGRFLISYYLSNYKMTSAYGAAGSLIVVLLWVYYSSIILYIGASFTHQYVINRGSRIYPTNYAVWVQQIEIESEKSISQQPEQKTVIEVPEQKTDSPAEPDPL